MTVRARYDGKNFVPIDPVDLPKEQMVELEVRAGNEQSVRRGSPVSIRQLMHSLPTLPKETMDEFRDAIDEGELPVRDRPVFHDEMDGG